MKDGFKGSRMIILPKSTISILECDLFGSKLHITDIGFYPEAALHYINRPKGITQCILIYCTKGKGWVEYGGVRYDVVANQCFLLPAGVPHSYGASQSEPWTIYWVHFKGELADFYLSGIKGVIDIEPNANSRIYDRLLIFENILAALDDGFNRDNIEFAISLLYYFLGSIKYLYCYRNVGGDKESDIVQRVIIYMKEYIERPLTLSQICEFAGYSESYFSTLFKEKTGYTPINYMIQLRMQEACRLLNTTDLKLNQICYKVGISDQYYFSKLFTKIMGVSPSKYRLSIK